MSFRYRKSFKCNFRTEADNGDKISTELAHAYLTDSQRYVHLFTYFRPVPRQNGRTYGGPYGPVRVKIIISGPEIIF